VIAAFGVGWCFTINAVSFLAVLASLLAMRVSELIPLVGRRHPTCGAAPAEGFSYVRHNRTILIVIAMMVVFASISFNFNILLPVLAKVTLHGSPITFGLISACFGAGALLGALASAAVGKSPGA
jgi:Bacterial protein of unknown function (DUF894).